MTNLCTKVTVRERPLKNGQNSVYLDFYPPVRNPKTGKLARREYLSIYTYANPKEKFEVEYNKAMMQKAELIKCKRIVDTIDNEFGFLDHNKMQGDFLQYFCSKMRQAGEDQNWQCAYKYFSEYCGGKCTFGDLCAGFCQGFLDYLLNKNTQYGRKMMSTTANNHLDKLKWVLRLAFDEGYIRENISHQLRHAKEVPQKKEVLTLSELKQLAATPCPKTVLKNAALFSCLTGLRISDIILLCWKNIEQTESGWAIHIITKKTKTEAVLPLSDEALSLCGERTFGRVFKGLSMGIVSLYLKDWVKSAGITKHITFHCFRHTYATLQIAAGTDIYTLSKMLTHSSVKTTQVYAEVVNDLKVEAAEKISLK
ncbi:MAG: site-specific integrase [Prevotella sp.]|jgi:site-specific recombinase XerD|nr:site-specific integrase [Prevotella sp.]